MYIRVVAFRIVSLKSSIPDIEKCFPYSDFSRAVVSDGHESNLSSYSILLRNIEGMKNY